MISFVLIAAAMIGVCLCFILVPLWRRPAEVSVRDTRRSANIEVYRQRCRELDAEVAAGRQTPAEAATEKDALGRRLLDDVAAGDREFVATEDSMARQSRPWLASVLSVVLVAAAGTLGYYWLGDRQALDERSMPNVDQMVAELKDQVTAHPDDRGTRLMLAEAYKNRGQFAEAADQLQAINARAAPPDADLLVAEAQDRLQAGEALDQRPGRLFQQALVQDPDNAQALWFLGLRAAERNEAQQAVGFWDRLLAQDLPPQVRRMVSSRRNALAGDVPGL